MSLGFVIALAFVLSVPGALAAPAAGRGSTATRQSLPPGGVVFHPMLALPRMAAGSTGKPSGGGSGGCSNTFPAITGTVFNPAQIRTAYGWSSTDTGSGKTIAILDAYATGTERQDLNCFDLQWGLPKATLKIVQPFGAVTTDLDWGEEISLDIEWAHVIAPSATLLLIESPAATDYYLINQSVPYAVAQGANVISMSFGAEEVVAPCAYWINEDVYFYNAIKQNVIPVAASGDQDGVDRGLRSLQVMFPGSDPYVLSVGGTSLTLGAGSAYGSETVWNNGIVGNMFLGSTGGQSACFNIAFADGQLADPGSPGITLYDGYTTYAPTGRGVPDVAFDADPNTGFWIYDSLRGNYPTSWLQVGGTSAGAPQWSAIIADIFSHGGALAYVDQEELYDAATSCAPPHMLHDVTTGANYAYDATTYWDGATGVGSPQIGNLIANYGQLYLC